jgi:hypothetical protein
MHILVFVPKNKLLLKLFNKLLVESKTIQYSNFPLSLLFPAKWDCQIEKKIESAFGDSIASKLWISFFSFATILLSKTNPSRQAESVQSN